jgi:hypothetical protein
MLDTIRAGETENKKFGAIFFLKEMVGLQSLIDEGMYIIKEILVF